MKIFFYIDEKMYEHGFYTSHETPMKLINDEIVFEYDKEILIKTSYEPKSTYITEYGGTTDVQIKISPTVTFHYDMNIRYDINMYIESINNKYTLYELATAIYYAYKEHSKKIRYIDIDACIHKLQIKELSQDDNSYFKYELSDVDSYQL